MHACLDQILERVLCKQLGAHIITHSNTHARFNERIDYCIILRISFLDVTHLLLYISHTPI